METVHLIFAILISVILIWQLSKNTINMYKEGMRKIPIEEACELCRKLPASKYCDSCVHGQIQQLVFKDPSGKTYDIKK